MSFILSPIHEPVRLKLARDRTRTLKRGYPWIYRDWLESLPAAPAGSRAIVKDRDGSLLAFGMYDPAGPLAVRVCAVEREKLDDALVLSRLEAALELRQTLFDEKTTGFRLLNGEGDSLPGLTCDLYADHAVLKLDGDAPAGFWNVEAVADWLHERLSIANVFLKYRSDAKTRGRAIRGEAPASPIRFLENGKHFQADIVKGQKTGFFFDPGCPWNDIRRPRPMCSTSWKPRARPGGCGIW
ncbi:MAG: class I SAM-dependent rRNA methyltransferase [Verrucomicrobiaceae bacterium]|nr:class I SAM-dependent rRNA methyltransferase [Verrucomicrobiaceae bacterium]